MADSTTKDTSLSAEAVLEGLERLSQSLVALNSKQSAPQLSHWRQLPPSIQQCFDLLHQGATLVHATSTKYTLVGKIDATKQAELLNDLFQGCQLLGTASVVLCQDETGCSRSLRSHVIHAVRGVVATVQTLIQSFVDQSAFEENVGAQKTGAVWQMCSVIMDKKLPVGNRNAMRRDLFTFSMECNETMQEFQELIDLGVALETVQEQEEEDGEAKIATSAAGETVDADWEAWMGGESTQQYTDLELPITKACIFLIKCSRGSLNCTLQACEAVGERLNTASANDETTTSTEASAAIALSDDDKARLQWISQVHDRACQVGEGMTDLGATLYPPLALDDVETQVKQQTVAVQAVVDYILDATFDGLSLDLPTEVMDLAAKLKRSVGERQSQALTAIAVARKSRSL